MKGAQYFSHDSNARNDEKIVALRIKLGWEGYGLYWAIVEKLRDSSNYRLSVNFNLLAFDLRTTNEVIKSIVTGFDLFTIEDDYFYSKSLCERMLIKDEASERARKKALKRWGQQGQDMQTTTVADATALPEHPKSDAKEGKERKVKESVVQNPPRAPSADWPGLTDQEAWIATQLNNLTEGKLPRDQIIFEAKKLLAKKPDPPYPFITTWAKNLTEAQNQIAAAPWPVPPKPDKPKLSGGLL